MPRPLSHVDLLAAWRRARAAGRPGVRGWPMALGVLWVAVGVLIAFVVLMLTLVAAVGLGGYLWLRRAFRKATPATLGHYPGSPGQGDGSRPAAGSRPMRPRRRVATGDIVDIEAREIPDPPPCPGR